MYHGEHVATGLFSAAGGVPAEKIARWDGSRWAPLGTGIVFNSTYYGGAVDLAAFNDDLIIAGAISSAGGIPVNNIARWDGQTWHAMGAGTNGPVYKLAVRGSELVASGSFTAADGRVAAMLARWTCDTCYANCDGSGVQPVLNVNDFRCFLARFYAGDPYANCDNSTSPPVLNVQDLTCFMNKFAAGCP